MLHETILAPGKPHIRYYPELHQGSDEWLEARRGILTASEVKLIMTPGGKIAKNDAVRNHVFEIAAQRISGFVEPRYIGDDMLRGQDDEIYARMKYVEHCAPVHEMGFIVNTKWGFPVGYSPDGLVGDEGGIETKSRLQRLQIKTMIEHVATGMKSIPPEFALQIQTGLIVSERSWIDFISYSGGLPMIVIRVWPDDVVQAEIREAAEAFEDQVREKMAIYGDAIKSMPMVIETDRRIIQEMF